MSVELIASGMPTKGIIEILRQKGFQGIPKSIFKYFFCSPDFDFKFRCMPSSGGFYNQRYRDYLEFGIIENKLREVRARQPK